MSYDFHPEALAEFESATDFYAECQPGLELRFIDAVQAAIARACEEPDRWRILQVRSDEFWSTYSLTQCCTLLSLTDSTSWP